MQFGSRSHDTAGIGHQYLSLWHVTCFGLKRVELVIEKNN
jgi:hypothetical protein